ncbi:hypothetical protein R3P38DRAFT_3253162 [Favolaschia claudopus]|uniref:MYND-type domain-containing protein n=1 Tax=Favolaschia claudopus TaxID=2862362 RepID=A0AAW0E293_9AGAR
MHPVMNTKNLDRLPLPRRRVAMTALKAGRSLQELQQVVAAMKSSPSAQKELYLPVFHACLDPANIPTKNEWELLRPESDISTRIAWYGDAFDYYLEYFLGKLRGGTVYYYVACAVGSVLEEVQELVQTVEFEEQEIYDHWFDFLWTAKDRVKLVHRMKGRAVLKACDNLDCGKIQDGSGCRRCSRCHSAYYCNSDCQRTDWTHGGHRASCGAEPGWLLGQSFITGFFVQSKFISTTGDSPSCPLNYRERVFLRFVLQSDYQSSRTTVCTAQVTHLSTSDSDKPFFILFNYRYCTPTPHSLELATDSKSGYTKNLQGPEWTNILARVRKSHGRMQLHVVNVVDGENDRLWVVSLRSSSAYIHKGVRELVSRIPDSEKYGARDVMKDIKEMLRGASDVVEIH